MNKVISSAITVENMTHSEAIACVNMLLLRIESLEKIVHQQQQEIVKLTARLAKDSHNSSKPPSSDGLARRPKSQRQPSGESVGGQPGHIGKTLKKSIRIDHTVVHPLPDSCDLCGQSLHNAISTFEPETRQVIDLPAIRFEVTEHRILRAQCRCGAQQCSQFPAHLTSAVQYGTNVRAAAVYLNQYQQVPFQRCAEAMHDLFGIKIAASSVVNHVAQMAQQLAPQVQQIKDSLLLQNILHFDETGMRQGKKLVWMHSVSSANLTWYGAHAKRGSEAINHFDLLPHFHGVAIHDGFKPYRQYPCQHGLCNAHHLRELTHIFETGGQAWAKEMMHLLCAAKDEVKVIRESHLKPSVEWIRSIDEQYHSLLRRGVIDNPEQLRPNDQVTKRGRVKQSDATNLLRRLYDYADDVLRFTTDLNVPFDNNQAERDIRMVKLKQKISGCFRSWDGLNNFCTIRSYLSTMRKNQHNLFDALAKTFNGQAPYAF